MIQKFEAKLRLAAVNVVTMVVRRAVVTGTIGRTQVHIEGLQKVQYINKKARRLKGDFEYKLYCKGKQNGYGGVGLIVK